MNKYKNGPPFTEAEIERILKKELLDPKSAIGDMPIAKLYRENIRHLKVLKQIIKEMQHE